MKLLVVDDEKMIRSGIVKILSDNFPNHEFFDAANGKIALEIYKKEKPDILLTDIKMPVMDGLELMKTIRAEDSKISIVVVTGFDDFSYARTALQCGASAYILKPIEKQELIETVSQLIKERMLSEKEKIERHLGRIYADGEESRNADILSTLMPYRVVALLNPTDDRPSNLYYFSPFNHGYYALERVDSRGEEKSINDMTVMGYSGIKNSLSDLREATLEAMVALFKRFIVPGQKEYYSDFVGNITNDIADKIGKISNQLGFSKRQDLKKNINSLFDFEEDDDKAYYLFSLQEALRNSILSKYSYSNSEILPDLISLARYKSLDEWRDDLTKFFIELNEKKKSEKPDNSFVTKSIEFINQNYFKDINMAVVSNEVGISYTYFSEKFKEYTGVNFNDFLTNFRINKAKELLEKGYYRIYEVSEKCGFSGPRYFIKIFKQITGVTPTAYMNSHVKEN